MTFLNLDRFSRSGREQPNLGLFSPISERSLGSQAPDSDPVHHRLRLSCTLKVQDTSHGRSTLAVLCLCFGLSGVVEAATPEPAAPTLRPARRPVALRFNREGTRLFVANRNNGSLSVIDARQERVIAEYPVGKGLADLVLLPDGTSWLALDQEESSVLLLEERDGSLQVVARQPVKLDPVKLVLTSDGLTCIVASRLGRALTFFSWSQAPTDARAMLGLTHTIDLPFSPRDMLLDRDGSTLIVADAFGGQLALIDVQRGRLLAVHSLPAHNIRGLALTPDGESLLLAHQELNPDGRAIQDDIQWGALVSNKVRVLKLAPLLERQPKARIQPPATPDQVIELGRFSGDPSALACDRKGRVILTLAGVDQVVTGLDYAHLEIRTGSGKRPTAIALDADQSRAYVADTLDDTVSVFEIKSGKRLAQIPLGPSRDPSIEERGERLFYDARLSRGGWMSCQSCHTDGHSNGLNVDTIGDGGYGAPKRVPSLFGTSRTGPWGWTGRNDRLDEQVHQSTVTTVQGVWPTESEVAEMSAFLRTLSLPRTPPLAPSKAASARRGQTLFEAQCATCHAKPEYTSAQRYDVGLADEVGQSRFNPPSLRGVQYRAPLLHDGRAKTLDEVFRKYRHPQDTDWTAEEVTDILTFLESL
ncbi:cytochrome c peroxidase [Singulisphaera acidiphila DSM 18658]|uniref:Cytochrome c peroxidase n=1 Tax=Singulisphaera acidiphila (strain ATCC BAA-1392 / DSM 18658 / VKM B-2454 / MOB10) TaxID=886293 RepID=L0DBF4_SINAD|nr:cytochrome c peroxidase [Singulisphaera acidiphila DSM 18658]